MRLQVSAKCGSCGQSGYLTFWTTTQRWHCPNCLAEVREPTGYEEGYDPNHEANQRKQVTFDWANGRKV